MHRKLAICLGLLLCAYLEFAFYPGHTYLAGSTQVLVPMVERLQEPGFLSRDLVATHPILRYTVYDEVTLLLHRLGKLSLEHALAGQQLAARIAEITGAYLLLRAATAPAWGAVLCSAVLCLGSWLPGAAVGITDPEPVPYALAFGFVMLGLGLAADGKILLCGLLTGIGLLYSPGIAVPAWLLLIVACIAKPALRPALRPAVTAFVIFALLLANLAQLQPGAPRALKWSGAASQQWLRVLQNRTPQVLVSDWGPHAFWFYLAIVTAGACALHRLWPQLRQESQLIFAIFCAAGLLAIPATALAQHTNLLLFTIQTEPARILLFTTAFTFLACGAAATSAVARKRWRESAAWMVCLGCIWGLTHLYRVPGLVNSPKQVDEMARWAAASTWGGSLFAFPDQGRSLDAGVFRAASLRSVYVDWQGGELARYYEDFGMEWQRRWVQLGDGRLPVGAISELLALPIDYYVLQAPHTLPDVRPVFRNAGFAVYDARELRSARRRFRAGQVE